jgi:hypothetical protein
VDNSGGNGRIKSSYILDAINYSSDNGNLARGLATCAVEADYLINMAVLKGHVGQGVTLCAKNYNSVTSIDPDCRKNAHNNFDQNRDGTAIAGSLGVLEHWNNPLEKKYSRNLDTGKGIELLYILCDKNN